MNKLLDRMMEMNIYPEDPAFAITNQQLMEAISEQVDQETVTNHELREIFFIVKKSLFRMNWQSSVNHSINHLPFGLNQTSIAWNGCNPCIGCPDAMIDNGSCYHYQECKSWEIYEARL